MGGGVVIAAGLVLLISIIQYQVEAVDQCDLYQGRWHCDSAYPLYNASHCDFMQDSFNCQANHRPDDRYLHYRWKPNDCILPRFNGRRFLRRMRGKRIMFVGDSISSNQWHSLNCMLHTSVPEAKYSLKRIEGLSTFKFLDYNVSVMLSRNALIVDIVEDTNGTRILKLNSVNNNGKLWRGIDTLIFNSWHWWLHTGRKQQWDMVQEGRALYKDMDRLVAYEKALVTWALWVKRNVDFTKTRVFFQGVSPDHFNITRQAQWGNSRGKTCTGQTVPALNNNQYNPIRYHPAESVAERVMKTISIPVHLLNITNLSQLRKDGHPSIYGSKDRKNSDKPDCTHWCLPGVPDSWNELLYASLIHNL